MEAVKVKGSQPQSKSNGGESQQHVDSAPPSYYEILDSAPAAPNHRASHGGNRGLTDDDLIAQIVASGISEDWARISLRRCNGNVSDAINFCIESGAMDDQGDESARIPESRAHMHKKKKKGNGILSRTFGGFRTSKQSTVIQRAADDNSQTQSRSVIPSSAPAPPSYDNLVGNIPSPPVNMTPHHLSSTPPLPVGTRQWSVPTPPLSCASPPRRELPPSYDDSTVSSSASDFPVEGGRTETDQYEVLPSYEQSQNDSGVSTPPCGSQSTETNIDSLSSEADGAGIPSGESEVVVADPVDGREGLVTGSTAGERIPSGESEAVVADPVDGRESLVTCSTESNQNNSSEDVVPDAILAPADSSNEDVEISPIDQSIMTGSGDDHDKNSSDVGVDVEDSSTSKIPLSLESEDSTLGEAEVIGSHVIAVEGALERSDDEIVFHASESIPDESEGLTLDGIRGHTSSCDEASESRPCSEATFLSSEDDPSTVAPSARPVSNSTFNLSVSATSELSENDDDDDESSVASSALLSSRNNSERQLLTSQASDSSLTLHMESVGISRRAKAAGVAVTVDSAGTITPVARPQPPPFLPTDSMGSSAVSSPAPPSNMEIGEPPELPQSYSPDVQSSIVSPHVDGATSPSIAHQSDTSPPSTLSARSPPLLTNVPTPSDPIAVGAPLDREDEGEISYVEAVSASESVVAHAAVSFGDDVLSGEDSAGTYSSVGIVTALEASSPPSRGTMRPESIARLPQANVVIDDNMDDDTVHGEAYVALGFHSAALNSSSAAVSNLYMRDERGGVYVAVAAPLQAMDEVSSSSGTDNAVRSEEGDEHSERRRGIFSYARHRLYGDEQGASRGGGIAGGVRRRVFLPFDINERDGKFFPSVHLRQPKLGPNMGPQHNRPPILNLSSSSSRVLAVRHAEVNTPPLWSGGDDKKECVICYHSAGLLYKIHHCRNCGYYVCNNCSKKDWPASMLPKTYVPEKETMVRVCDSCSYIQEGFMDALRVGDVNLAMAFFSTGNANLHSPMSIYKSEEYPLHAASQGGNIHLVRWLLEERKCSLRGVGGEVLTTSEGLTPLAIASYFGHQDVMSYFVRRHGCQVTEIKDFTVLLRGLHAALGASGDLPEGGGGSHGGIFRGRRAVPGELETVERGAETNPASQSRPVPAQLATGNRTMTRVPTTVAEVAPSLNVSETSHRPKLAFGKRRSINPRALTQTRRSIESSPVFSENPDAQTSVILSAAVRSQPSPRPSPGSLDSDRHMVLPYTEEDVVPFTEDMQLQYDAPILRAQSARANEDLLTPSSGDRGIPRNRSAPIRVEGSRQTGIVSGGGRPSPSVEDDDDVSVDTAMASHFDSEVERSYNRPSDRAVNEHVRSRIEADEVEMRGVLSRASSGNRISHRLY